MRRWLIGIGLLSCAVALFVNGCLVKSCTAIGCQDQFSATLSTADGSFPGGDHRVEVTADGVSLTCNFTFPLPMYAGSTYQPSCPTGMSLMVWPATVCTDKVVNGTGVHECDPIPGQFVETILLPGTPANVQVRQYVDDTAILDVAAAPSYRDDAPNGTECGPVCRQASVAWTLN